MHAASSRPIRDKPHLPIRESPFAQCSALKWRSSGHAALGTPAPAARLRPRHTCALTLALRAHLHAYDTNAYHDGTSAHGRRISCAELARRPTSPPTSTVAAHQHRRLTSSACIASQLVARLANAGWLCAVGGETFERRPEDLPLGVDA